MNVTLLMVLVCLSTVRMSHLHSKHAKFRREKSNENRAGTHFQEHLHPDDNVVVSGGGGSELKRQSTCMQICDGKYVYCNNMAHMFKQSLKCRNRRYECTTRCARLEQRDKFYFWWWIRRSKNIYERGINMYKVTQNNPTSLKTPVNMTRKLIWDLRI